MPFQLAMMTISVRITSRSGGHLCRNSLTYDARLYHERPPDVSAVAAIVKNARRK